jgi:cytochrome c-type biogenesis protein CcmE
MASVSPEGVEFKSRRGSPTKFLIAGGLILAAVVVLVFTATRSTAVYYLTVDELLQRQAELRGDSVRVAGIVVGDSVEYDVDSLLLRFDLRGAEASVLPVVFEGPKPDQLKDGAEAVVEGRLAEGRLEANTVLLKCPSKYEEELGVSEEKVEAVR